MQTIHDLFSGTWVANLEKSDPDPNHRFRQATMRLTRTERGYELRAEGIGPDGQPCAERPALINLDGGTEVVEGVTVTSTATGNRIEVIARRDQEVVGRAAYTVSEDGRSLTAETWGTDAKGRSFKTKVVFDRSAE